MAVPARSAYPPWSWIADGLAAGLVASTAHWIAYHAMTALAEGEPLEPSRYMASVLLGRDAFDDPQRVGALVVLAVGVVGHLLVSLPWSLVFVKLAHELPAWFASPERSLLTGAAWGLVVWVASVYVLTPAVGMVWFADQEPATLAAVHLVFGSTLGLATWARVGLAAERAPVVGA